MTDPDDTAYPIYRDSSYKPFLGLTKRELFAAMAMQGMPNSNSKVIARWAVDQADELIMALNQMGETDE